ncbi:Putative uncharacterized protein [Moritella viscosa]|nr:Putative uncharacterized protein [Moritella viscosa]
MTRSKSITPNPFIIVINIPDSGIIIVLASSNICTVLDNVFSILV